MERENDGETNGEKNRKAESATRNGERRGKIKFLSQTLKVSKNL